MTKDRILLVDGLNAFIRNWTIVPSMDSNGAPNGGVLGFLRSVKVIMRDVKPSRVIVVWDGKDGSKKRRSMFSGYKDGRRPRLNREYDFEGTDQSKANMLEQYAKLRKLLRLLGVLQVEEDGCEADDAIAYLAKHVYSGTDKVILSSDKDFLQLVDQHTIVYSPSKKVYWSRREMKERINILPENFIYAKALMGDGSDNIKGINGFGEKTIVKLFPFLSERVSNVQEILEHAKSNEPKSSRYKGLLAAQDVFISNVQLMQLSTPIISAQSARSIRLAVEEKPNFVLTEFKLALVRDGVQLTDADFFPVWNEYRMKAGP